MWPKTPLCLLLGLIGCTLGTRLAAATLSTQDDQPNEKIKILCFVLSTNTAENNLKSQAVERTWGKRCDKLLIIKNGARTEEVDGQLTVDIDHDGRDQLWHKVSKAYSFIYGKYLEEYDWFVRADDDTYMLVDALRQFLTTKSSPQEPIHFGHRFKKYVRSGYMSGGSGIVMSREALRRMVELGFNEQLDACELRWGQVDDLIIGKCLEAVGVRAGDTRDSLGKETFLPLSPEMLLNDVLDKDHWYHTYAYYEASDSITGSTECCSKTPIGFHYIDDRQMYLIDWLLYDVKRPHS